MLEEAAPARAARIVGRVPTRVPARVPARVLVLAVALSSAIAACSPADVQEAPAEPNTAGWIASPLVSRVDRAGDGLVVHGTAAPSGRVVIRSEAGAAYAVGADAQGRFDLRILAPASDTLFMIESRNGQDASPAPYRLLVTRDPRGPIALLAAGAPSIRLDAAGPLDVIDSDGQALLASGRAAPGATATVVVGQAAPVQAMTRQGGRWSAPLDVSGSAGAAVSVGGRTYAYPGAALPAAPGVTATATGDGWRVSWSLAPGAGQSSWFPAAGS